MMMMTTMQTGKCNKDRQCLMIMIEMIWPTRSRTKTVNINKDQNIQHIRIVNLINLHSPKKSFPISGVCRQVRRSVRAGLRAGLQVWALQSRGRPGLGRWGLGPRRKKCGKIWFLPPEMVAKPTTKWDTMRINENQSESMRINEIWLKIQLEAVWQVMVFDGYSGYQMTVLEYHISIDDHQVANKKRISCWWAWCQPWWNQPKRWLLWNRLS